MEPNQPPSQVPYIHAETVDMSRSNRPRRGPGFVGGCLFIVILLALGVSLLVNLVLFSGSSAMDSSSRLEERHVSHNQRAYDKIAIVTVEGTILEGRGFVKRQIERVRKDESVKAVVLRVNSPGGTVSGSDYILHHLNKMTAERGIPLVVSMGSLAASGGYYVSMAVGNQPNTILAEPTTWTGSIGVLIPHFNLAKLMEDWGIESDTVVSGRFKGMGSVTHKMTEDERKIFQALVNDAFSGFKDVIKSGRPKFKADPAALDKIATGQVYTAQQAVANGLVDKVGFVEDAVARAIELSGLPPSEVNVVEYRPEFSIVDLVLGGSAAKHSTLELEAILELAAPRAYYLCTWLPPILSNAR
jgi:protease IV